MRPSDNGKAERMDRAGFWAADTAKMSEKLGRCFAVYPKAPSMVEIRLFRRFIWEMSANIYWGGFFSRACRVDKKLNAVLFDTRAARRADASPRHGRNACLRQPR